MAESRREQRLKRIRAKKPRVRWYMLRVFFWSMVLAYGFVMFLIGFMVGEYL